MALNINIFFIILSVGLMMIFLLFKPMHIQQHKFIDLPLFELSSFSLYELNKKGLNNIMLGSKATKYNDRYSVENIDYTDNSRNFIANMKSNTGVYKNDIVNLEGNVTYTREDGLVFVAPFITYNKQTTIASTDSNYVLYKGKDRISGTSLRYNNISDQVSSKNVLAIYNFKDKQK